MTKPTGWKIGCLPLVLCFATAISSPAQVFTTLFEFDGTTGAQPMASLVQGRDGYFYGTTAGGGDLTCGPGEGCGTVFRVAPNGQLTVLHAFAGEDGMFPWGALVLGVDGNFYGTTSAGGDLTCMANLGCGTVFKITPQGELATLHAFENTDGASPIAGLIQAIDGNFYGTASAGGNSTCSPPSGCGTVFEISPEGAFKLLHIFDGTDGATPNAALLEVGDGNFYGTTFLGGSSGCDCGTVFKMTPRGNLTVLHEFGLTEGAFPAAAFLDSDGGLYSASSGGGRPNLGTVFRSSRSGAVTDVHQFWGGDGALPYAPLIAGTDGNAYGTAYYGGSYGCNSPHGCGTVFTLTPQGKLSRLHRFNGRDGSAPYGALLQTTSGIFYGTTSQGGNSNCFLGGCGTVFSLDMGLGPFVAFVQAVGRVGQTGGILGQGFTSTTSVELNGVPANFTVVSDTYLTATVPPGATTGYVTVTTPSGVLKSNVPFRVIR